MPSDPLLNGRSGQAFQTFDGVAYFSIWFVGDSKVVSWWSLPLFFFGSLIGERNSLVSALSVFKTLHLSTVKGFGVLVHPWTQGGFVPCYSFYSRVIFFLFIRFLPKNGMFDSGRCKLVGNFVGILSRTFCFHGLPSCMLDKTAEFFIFRLVRSFLRLSLHVFEVGIGCW